MGKGKLQTRINTLTRCLMLSLAATAGCVVSLTDVHAQAQQSTAGAVRFDIPAGSLAAALDSFAEQSGLQIVSDQPLQGIRVPALQGRLAPEEALRRLLRGSGFTYKRINAQTFVLKKQPVPPGPRRGAAGQNASGATQASEPEVRELAGVTVTGTRIRGGSTPSPVITIGSEQIQQEGFSDLGEVIRRVPQNFSGGQNPGVQAGANVSGNNYNATGGSSLNLRGLGPDATLTLLNGRRMSYAGTAQAVDISAIPVEAVERLEIVPDGASAIYGSDAVGGVANVILKRDFEGVTVGTRYGGATEGGLTTREYRATAGTVWSTGGLIVAGMKTSNDPIYSDQRDYAQSMYRPSTLWQRNDLRSGLLSLHQSLGNSIELRLDGLRSDRSIMTGTAYPGVYYHNAPEIDTTLVSPSLEWYLANDWSLTVNAAFGRDKILNHQQTVSAGTGAISSNTIDTYVDKGRSYEIGAEGRLFALPGGDARLAVGTGYRYNGFDHTFSHTPIAAGDESSRFGYAELSLPVIGPGQGVHGVESLALTGAIRTEDYRTYGRVNTPKFGLIYSPNANFTIKTSWGRSFKAPRFLQRYSAQYVLYYPQTTFGGTGYPADATALYRTGGGDDLRPERARTWSTSLAFHPDVLPGLEAELTWFDINYTERVLQPITSGVILGNPIYAKFIDYDPTEPAKAAAVASASNLYNYVGAPYDASKVVAIIDDRYVNAARQKIKGVDLSGSYRSDLGAGQLTIRGSASWLDSTQATTPGQSPYDLSGTLFFPARLSGRIGAVWTHGGFSASFFGNYKGGVTDPSDDNKGASFTTFDAALRYGTGERDGPWSNVTMELSAQNLFDRAPPLFSPLSLADAPYDSTNYSAVGRFLSLSLSKHW
jgi:outer membrane receptor protein involved in Fe transport